MAPPDNPSSPYAILPQGQLMLSGYVARHEMERFTKVVEHPLLMRASTHTNPWEHRTAQRAMILPIPAAFDSYVPNAVPQFQAFPNLVVAYAWRTQRQPHVRYQPYITPGFCWIHNGVFQSLPFDDATTPSHEAITALSCIRKAWHTPLLIGDTAHQRLLDRASLPAE